MPRSKIFCQVKVYMNPWDSRCLLWSDEDAEGCVFDVCSAHDAGADAAAHVLGCGVLRGLWEEPLVGHRCSRLSTLVSRWPGELCITHTFTVHIHPSHVNVSLMWTDIERLWPYQFQVISGSGSFYKSTHSTVDCVFHYAWGLYL